VQPGTCDQSQVASRLLDLAFFENSSLTHCQASSSRNMSAVDTSSEWIDITGDGGVLKKILKVGAGQWYF
jgi:hypothetical protein